MIIIMKRWIKKLPFVAKLYSSYRETDGLANALKLFFLKELARRTEHAPAFLRRWIPTPTIRIKLRHPCGKMVDLTFPSTPQLFNTLYEIFHNRDYEPIAPTSSPVTTILDMGANFGLATVFLAPLYPKAKFICVEADPANLSILKQNLENNNIQHILEGSALTQEGVDEIEFKIHRESSEYNTIGTSIFPDSEYRIIRVPALSLKQLLKKHNIDRVHLAKIDIEGAEFQVLVPGSEELKKIDYLMGEFHSFGGDIENLSASLENASGLKKIKDTGRTGVPILHFRNAQQVASAAGPR